MFVKLTKRDGSPIYLNMKRVTAITIYQDETAIDIDGWDNYLYVKESPDAIMALIELKERGKNA